MQRKIRIGVVDDHPLYRDGVVSALEAEADIEIVGQGETATDAIQMAHDHAPDILLIDLSIPGGGLNALAKISLRCPSTRILRLPSEGNYPI
jgi:two-component system nitrate/nitrite response regulator NarL